ncbi:MAG: DNA repair protein RecN [Candidatus Riflebacteria bacterium]|nr:DNA repair protein RecN [Candidatus Riflebacteria bacterium]
MIKEIELENFLFIPVTHLEFREGLNVVTGETGAGKSVLLEAIKLLLGKKGRTGLVLDGKSVARLQAGFDLARVPAAREYLEKIGLANEENENSLSISRTFKSEGTEKVFVNGIMTTTTTLRELGRLLMEIHGQNDHQTLLESRVQRNLLDRTGGQTHIKRLIELTRCHDARRELQKRIDDLKTHIREGAARQDELARTSSDLAALNLASPDEEAQLIEEADRLQNAEAIAEGLRTASNALSGIDDQVGAVRLVHQCREALHRIICHDSHLVTLAERIETVYRETIDLETETSRACERLSFDPERLGFIQARLAEIGRCCRRYSCNVADLFALRVKIEAEMAELTAPDSTREKLENSLKAVDDEHNRLACEITNSRKKLALKLEKVVSAEMVGLGFPQSKFQVVLNPLEPGPDGAETVDFVVALNPGAPPGSLRKIASGGELSRVALALKKVLARSDELPTLIFDEIDTGIGGIIAEAVAKSLKSLSVDKQVILVTHLHQIAKEGDRHFTVEKSVKSKNTIVKIEEVCNQAREAEIARMLGTMGHEGLIFARSILKESSREE